MENSMIIIAYATYLPIAILLTYYVARNLFRNSEIFMLEIFRGKKDIALATNKLFEIGFYLLNIGYVLLILKMTYINSYQDVIERVSFKLGGVSIYLGILLFFNLYLLFRGKRASKQNGEKVMEVPNSDYRPV
ncbi:MAG: hypothetical protein HRT58_03305 [Crocinitomicaceae bacterium]|nr:hypothetical protein [Flavobacteriales bacterium]NQZ34659.1 hypothetical protein [Crocinitomicaceae bacterium]